MQSVNAASQNSCWNVLHRAEIPENSVPKKDFDDQQADQTLMAIRLDNFERSNASKNGTR